MLTLSMMAYADPVPVAGLAAGTFSSTLTDVLGGLRYNGGLFATPNWASTPEVQHLNFGSFRLSPNSFNYNNARSTFSLNLSFLAPMGATVSSAASVTGRVNNGGNIPGGQRPTINFGGPTTVNFAGGSFLLTLNDVVFSSFETRNLTGTISGGVLAAATPEPQSILLFGTVLGGLGLLCRKRFARG